MFYYYWGKSTRKSFVIPRTSVYKDSLYQGSTVTIFSPSDLNFLEQPVKIQQNKLYNSKKKNKKKNKKLPLFKEGST